MSADTSIGRLTLEEKAALLQGWTTWSTRGSAKLNLPVSFLSDGPHGLRKQAGASDHLGLNASVPATCFPTAATMANSWDPSLGEELGRALGEEAAANDVNVVLGPGLNIKRSPLCGRNFEYFSEDPYLAGKMAAAYVRGIQSNGVVACPKHFAVNSQELRRMCMDSVVDERTLREIYLTGFEIAVAEGNPGAIMTSYNMVNGVYANENPHLIGDILRGEWGFKGFAVTDWGGDNDHAAGVEAGSDLVMPAPGPDCAVSLIRAVREGRIKESTLDERLMELVPVLRAAGRAVSAAPKVFDSEEHHRIARKCAEGSIVLLENDGILPLCPGTEVVLIGDFAETPRYQGAGSSVVNPTKLENLLECAASAGLDVRGFARGYDRANSEPARELIEEATALAAGAGTVLLCVGLDELAESEGLDRSSLDLPENQRQLIEAVAAVNKNVVLVLSGGAPFLMPGRGLYRAAIHGYLGGQAGASAMADALAGKLNPSGKLSETWPLRLEDTPSYSCYPSRERTSEYREGLYVGYRYYDTTVTPVRYPFGYGLSYTTFEYSNLRATDRQVSFTLTNTGKMDGAEIAQIYVSRLGGQVFRPRKELKGFTKVFLRAGESREVTVTLDDKAFRYFNVKTNRWEVEEGEYRLLVCSSSESAELTACIKLDGTNAPAPYGSLPSYESGRAASVPDEEFEALLGRPIPDGSWGGVLTSNDALCQLKYAESAPARLVYKILTDRKNKAEAKGKPDLNILFIYNMPFRAIAKMSGGMVSEKMTDDLVFLVNGHFWRGLGRFIADFFRNKSAGKRFLRQLEINEKNV